MRDSDQVHHKCHHGNRWEIREVENEIHDKYHVQHVIVSRNMLSKGVGKGANRQNHRRPRETRARVQNRALFRVCYLPIIQRRFSLYFK
jgi:hypothetical protein